MLICARYKMDIIKEYGTRLNYTTLPMTLAEMVRLMAEASNCKKAHSKTIDIFVCVILDYNRDWCKTNE